MTGCMDGQGVFALNRTIPPNQNFMLSVYHFDDSGPGRNDPLALVLAGHVSQAFIS